MAQSVWLILPTYNEAENIEQFTREVLLHLGEAFPDRESLIYRVLIVDDNSPDGTGEIADRLANENTEIEVMHRPGKAGLGQAYLAGFSKALAAGADFICEMDSDFSHSPADLPRLVAAAREGADLVLGSRYVPGGGVENWGLIRRLLSRGGCIYARLILGLKVRDLTGGFKCFKREVLESIELETVRSQGYTFQIELTYRTLRRGFKVREIPIVFKDRTIGTSKMSTKIALEAIWLVPSIRINKR